MNIEKFIKDFLAKRAYKNAVKKANKGWYLTGKQHHVFMIDEGKYRVINRDTLKHFCKKTGKKLGFLDIAKHSVYSTPVGNRLDRAHYTI